MYTFQEVLHLCEEHIQEGASGKTFQQFWQSCADGADLLAVLAKMEAISSRQAIELGFEFASRVPQRTAVGQAAHAAVAAYLTTGQLASVPIPAWPAFAQKGERGDLSATSVYNAVRYAEWAVGSVISQATYFAASATADEAGAPQGVDRAATIQKNALAAPERKWQAERIRDKVALPQA